MTEASPPAKKPKGEKTNHRVKATLSATQFNVLDGFARSHGLSIDQCVTLAVGLALPGLAALRQTSEAGAILLSSMALGMCDGVTAVRNEAGAGAAPAPADGE